MNSPETLEQRALEIARSLKPQTILIVGNLPVAFVESDLASRIGITAVNHEQDIEALAPCDLALITQALNKNNFDLMRLLVARLRDRLAKRFLLLAQIEDDDAWNQNELVALGLSRIKQIQNKAGERVLYHYNIKTYKQTPDWLNAKYWANPEQFNNDIPEEMREALGKHEQAPKKLITLGDHLKSKRLGNKQTIEQAAAELKIAPVTLWRWEANHYEPQPENLPAIVLYLGYRPDI